MDLEAIENYIESELKTHGSIIFQYVANRFNIKGPEVNKLEMLIHGSEKFILFRTDITGNLSIKKNPVYKKKTWSEKHPVLDKFRTGAITAGFSLLVGITLYLITTSKDNQRESQQQKRLDNLSDSVNKIQNRLDSLK